jgi:hypothetical protein
MASYHCVNCGRPVWPIEDEAGDDWLHKNGSFRCFPDGTGTTVAYPDRKPMSQAAGEAQ